MGGGENLGWLALTSLVGGIIGGGVGFVYSDVFRPWLGWQRETKRVVRKYSVPLTRTAESLERQVFRLVRNEAQRPFESDDEYFRLAFLYQFGQLLGWIRIIELRFGFLPFQSSRQGRIFNDRTFGVFKALCSPAYFFEYPEGASEAVRRQSDTGLRDRALQADVPRLVLSAVGEEMIRPGDEPALIEFREFAGSYTSDHQFRRWFERLEEFHRAGTPGRPDSVGPTDRCSGRI